MRRLVRPLAVLIVVAGLASTTGCDDCSPWNQSPSSWKYASNEADYQIVFPGSWETEPPRSINPHADVAASRDQQLFFMVVPQPLPSFPDPDVIDLKKAALEMLDDSVEDLVIERQGPVKLDGVSGMSVVASGTVDGEPTRYVTCYVIRGDTGYQIISFAREQHASRLFEEVDEILAGWQFVDRSSDGETPDDDIDESSPDEGPLQRADPSSSPESE